MENSIKSCIESLDSWLEYIESLHRFEIEFGLERVSSVFNTLFPDNLSSKVIIVGGTNGKGTTCSFLESILLASGYSCGKNTSPHINRFNERIFINGAESSDEEIIRAFQQVELARKDTLLTYFEFTFLAALTIFEEHKVDYSICEVGMGGRLDAVNILSPEVSIITTIGLDHTEWLGDSLEKISMEKVAISRPNKPCVVGEKHFPRSAKKYLQENQVESFLNDEDFAIDINDDGHWNIKSALPEFEGLNRLPKLDAMHLYQNAACAVLSLIKLDDFHFDLKRVQEGLRNVTVDGRCQILSQEPLIILDVAHNPESVNALSDFIDSRVGQKRKIAVCSMLGDKDISSALEKIIDQIDEWYIAPLTSPRAASVEEIQSTIRDLDKDPIVKQFDSIETAYLTAKKSATKDDCLVVFGSFFVVSDILRHHQNIG